MFELAAAASCMPCHEPSLNDLSLIVPLSATMQALNLAAVPAPVPFDDELGLAHPAASKATAARTAAARKACLTCYLLFRAPVAGSVGTGSRSPLRTGGPLLAPSAHEVEVPRRLLRDDRRLDRVSRPGKAAGSDRRRRCQIATVSSAERPGRAGIGERTARCANAQGAR